MWNWNLVLGLLLIACAGLIWSRPRLGAFTSFVAVFLFFQLSAAYFLIPVQLYKDGGNGTFADWWVWGFWSLICTGVMLFVVLGLRRLARTKD